MKAPNFLGMLRILRAKKIDFIVVGGVAGVLHGAHLTTFDLGVVHSREPGNIERLLEALDVVEARYRTLGARRQKPDRSNLLSSGLQLLITRAGPLDLPGTIGHDYSYDDLIGHTIGLDIGKGLEVRVLDLPTLIKVKAQTAGDKDKAAVMVLRRVLQEKSAK